MLPLTFTTILITETFNYPIHLQVQDLSGIFHPAFLTLLTLKLIHKFILG